MDWNSQGIGIPRNWGSLNSRLGIPGAAGAVSIPGNFKSFWFVKILSDISDRSDTNFIYILSVNKLWFMVHDMHMRRRRRRSEQMSTTNKKE